MEILHQKAPVRIQTVLFHCSALRGRKNPGLFCPGLIILFNETPAKSSDFSGYESLLSSRLYCRYRNSLCGESPVQPLYAGRGLYRRLGLSPDPEDQSLFLYINIALYKYDFKGFFGIYEISFFPDSPFFYRALLICFLFHLPQICRKTDLFPLLKRLQTAYFRDNKIYFTTFNFPAHAARYWSASPRERKIWIFLFLPHCSSIS